MGFSKEMALELEIQLEIIAGNDQMVFMSLVVCYHGLLVGEGGPCTAKCYPSIL